MKVIKALVLIVIAVFIISCDKNPENPTFLTIPTVVASVEVNPANETVTIGQTAQFQATVIGSGDPEQTVLWSVTGNASSTSINTSGLLTVAIDETAEEIRIIATSTVDTNKSGNAAVRITNVTNVEITPAQLQLIPSESYQFEATVNGNNNPPQMVTWVVTGGIAGTNINSNGLLTVASNQTAGTLTVTATSVTDTSKSGNATVAVPVIVTSVAVTPAQINLIAGDTRQFSANVQGSNEPSQNVEWAVSGGVAGTNIDANGLLAIAISEIAETITVTATSADDPEMSGNAAVVVTSVASVSISPDVITLSSGDTHQFSVVVSGNNTPTQAVSWDVLGGNSGTFISSSGYLTIASTETAEALTITATSAINPTKVGTATVLVKSVSTVSVAPATLTINSGETCQFNATVHGNNNPSQSVSWSVIGGVTGTNISNSGLLTVANTQTAGVLTVKATSAADPTKNGTATVTVPVIITDIVVTPAQVNLFKGDTYQFSAVVNGENNPSQAVNWSVSGGVPGTSINASGFMTIANNETAGTLTVTATSSVVSTVSGNSTVLVTSVSSVEVTPATITLNSGNTHQFNALVSGNNGPSQDVTWAVLGGVTGTSISATGFLTVASTQTSGSLTVKATSTADPTVSGNATVTVPVIISSVVVTPSEVFLYKGGTQQFNVVVNGENNPSQSVTWVVIGGIAGTHITTSGLLTVASNETATDLTVTATSTADPTQSGTASAGVVTITGITITPANVTLNSGDTRQFSAEVSGTNNPPQTVNWTVTGGVAGTSISDTGFLTVASTQTSGVLTVTATSTVDQSKTGTATVTIPVIISSVIVSPSQVTLIIGQTCSFSVTINGSNNPSQAVNWAVAGGVAGTNINSSGLLTVASNETALTLNVTATSVADPLKSGSASVIVTSVSSVVISHPSVNLARGESWSFSAVVNGNNNPSQDVVWTVTGGVTGTGISSGGLLVVSNNETSALLTVRATSVADPTKFGTSLVTIINPLPIVTDVEVTPTEPNVIIGQTCQFNAVVIGGNSPSQAVTWTVMGGTSNGTGINTNGLLLVATNEQAPTLIVTATSVADPTKSSSVTVNVINVISVEVTPATVTIPKGFTQQFNTVVIWTNSPHSQNIIWTITGGINGSYIDENGLLTVSVEEEDGSTIHVTATSTTDPTKNHTAIVTVTIIGSIGPAGGNIFYDKGFYSDGWRYMESAPANSDFFAAWGLHRIYPISTGAWVGTGQENTTALISYLVANNESGKAAQLCDELVINGYDDWFLPSKDELHLMYLNLCEGNNIGEFQISSYYSSQYWSSSSYGTVGNYTWFEYFLYGSQQNTEARDFGMYIRAARRF